MMHIPRYDEGQSFASAADLLPLGNLHLDLRHQIPERIHIALIAEPSCERGRLLGPYPVYIR